MAGGSDRLGSSLWSGRFERLAGSTLLLICLAAYSPGFRSLPPIDRDESRFAQASQTMVVSSSLDGWAVPRLQGQPRLVKPPLIYWLQSAAVIALGERQAAASPWGGSIWLYRVPSLVSALMAVWLTWRLGRSLFGVPTGWLGALLLGCCPMVLWDARQARADELLLAFTVLAQWSLWRAWDGRGEARVPGWIPAVFWLAVAGGVMAKGPVTPMVAALTIVSLGTASHEWQWAARLRPWRGALLVAALVVPWVVIVSSRVGWERFSLTACRQVIYDLFPHVFFKHVDGCLNFLQVKPRVEAFFSHLLNV